MERPAPVKLISDGIRRTRLRPISAAMATRCGAAIRMSVGEVTTFQKNLAIRFKCVRGLRKDKGEPLQSHRQPCAIGRL
jgi:hypothetical protein